MTPSRRFRVSAFAVLGLLFVYGYVHFSDLLPEAARGPATNIVQALTALGAAVMCTWKSSVSPRRSRVRWSWVCFSAGSAVWGFGQCVWVYYALARSGEPPFPGVADFGFMLFIPFTLAAVMLADTGDNSVMSTWRSVIDGLTIASALLFISWALVLGPAYRAGASSRLNLVISLTYPIGDVVILSVALAVLSKRRGSAQSSLTVVLGGVAAIAMADSLFAFFTLHDSVMITKLPDVMWSLGFALIGLSTILPPARQGGHQSSTRASIHLVAPAIPVLSMAVVFGITVIRGRSLDLVLAWSSLATGLFIIIRQPLLVRENLKLTTRIEHKMDELQAQHGEMRRLALHDGLTGMANRALFNDRLHRALSRRERSWVAVIYIDLDDFKVINDTLGHGAGDDLLKHVARKISEAVRPEDTAARLGGDEFGVVMESIESPMHAREAAERVLNSIVQPMFLAGKDTRIRASLGVALASAEMSNPESLLANADMALYDAKRSGKSCVSVFADFMRASLLEGTAIKSDLHGAVERGEITVNYQPVVDIGTGEVVGVEALARWNHPDRGWIPPSLFIRLAEESGVVVQLGSAVLRQACAAAMEWQNTVTSGRPLTVNVNLSTRQLQRSDVMTEVRTALAASGLPASQLVLELTETVLIDDVAETASQLADLRALGVRISIDDFGTGYSSLSYLHQFDLDILKIDKQFVETMTWSDRDARFVEAIVSLGRLLDLEIVAEGIETEAQRELLTKFGCTTGQGFLFSPALTQADMARYLAMRSALGWNMSRTPVL